MGQGPSSGSATETSSGGGVTTLIGVTAGDRVNFVIHPASQTSSVLLLYNARATYMYRIDGMYEHGEFEVASAYFFKFIAICTENRTGIPLSFLPFGYDHGDLTAPSVDDGNTDEIVLGTDIVIFGSRHNHLYVSHNNDNVDFWEVYSYSYV